MEALKDPHFWELLMLGILILDRFFVYWRPRP